MKKNTILAGMIILITQADKAVALSTATKSSTPQTAVRAGDITVILKSENGNYAPYGMHGTGNAIPTLQKPTLGTLNTDGKLVEYEMTLKVVSTGNKGRLKVQRNTWYLIRLNNKPGSTTLCEVRFSITKNNMVQITMTETTTSKAFKNDQNKVEVPMFTGNVLETLISDVCVQVGWLNQLDHVSTYNAAKAGVGIPDLSALLSNFDVKEQTAEFLTKDATGKPVFVNMPWNKVIGVTDDVTPTPGVALTHKGFNERHRTLENLELVLPEELTVLS
jgi:hypothetical protein